MFSVNRKKLIYIENARRPSTVQYIKDGHEIRIPRYPNPDLNQILIRICGFAFYVTH